VCQGIDKTGKLEALTIGTGIGVGFFLMKAFHSRHCSLAGWGEKYKANNNLPG
jgi:hypothetical protein